MLTLQPAQLRGPATLALTSDEAVERVALVQAALRDRGLEVLLAYGDARSYGPLTWLTGLVPMLKWAVALVPANGDVALYSALPGAREVLALRPLAHAARFCEAAALPAAIAPYTRIAVAGLRVMRSALESTIRSGKRAVEDAEGWLTALMSPLSASERAQLRRAASTAREAADAVAASYAAGACISDALLDGDLGARLAGVHDVRVMWSTQPGAPLRPLEHRVDVYETPFTYYLAVESAGYWGEALRSLAPVDSPLVPLVRLGLSIVDASTEKPSSGFYSWREYDAAGRLSSRTVEL